MNDEKTKVYTDNSAYPSDHFIKNEIVPHLKDLAFAVCVIMVLFFMVFRVVVVDGSSMYDTLVHGDYVLLLNSFIAGEPQQGDIVVASKNAYADGTPIIKRVIATEGQTVDINFETAEVFVDGILLDEPYIHSPTDLFQGVSFPLVVDEGCIFVLGDNRGVSKDSRNPQIGLIDCREIVGKAIFLLFPGENPAVSKREFDRIGVVK